MKKSISYFLVLAFIGFMGVAAEANILPNGDFEADPPDQYWNSGTGGNGVVDFSYNDGYLRTDAASDHADIISDKFSASATTYNYSFEYSVDNFSSDDLAGLFQLRFFDSSGSFLGEENVDLADTGSSTITASGSASAPAGTSTADVRVSLGVFNDFTGDLIIDNILIEADLWIVTQPEGVLANEGDDVSFTAEADAASGNTPSYQWYKSADSIIGGEDDQLLSGETAATLTIADVTSADTGFYYCEASVNSSTITTNAAFLSFGDLVAHWSMDEADVAGSDPNYYSDLTGNGHNANIEQSVPVNFVDGVVTGDQDIENLKPNGAVEIDHLAGTANAGTFDPAAESGEWSVSLWLNWNDTGLDSVYNNLWSKRDGWGFDSIQYMVHVYDDWDGAVIMETPGGGWIGTGGGAITPGQWHHLVITYDSSQRAEIWLNSELEAANDNYVMGTKSDATFWIGRNDSTAEWFDGAIDDFKVFNYALSDTDIYDLYYDETGDRRCLEELRPEVDLNGDCVVDFVDFSLLAEEWLNDGNYTPQAF
ncbi:LamG-like jellyroll fold domain-containing protein [Sedimentisphaera salicampi]|uniref:Immunoglobulin I-set domain protein n=1 Tax=Sedimentisphaera salicampi TaxID=1941349 RepID=A0A1W6LKH5_9BACT|nr:LamG-like jellyroll fold domain-containing protein [Sedimentisphaera salicampi]ARN56252.1 Immunoglobulin I-set domain protein [Sedimentisphaera salicampi]